MRIGHPSPQAILQSILTTRGDLLYRAATQPTRLAKGTNLQILRMGANDPAWSDELIGEGHITILPYAYQSIGQGTWAFASDNSQFLRGYLSNSTAADADNISFNVYLAKGTYTLRILTRKTPDLGILDVDIDAAEVASEDLYDAGAIQNYSMSQAAIAVATSGIKTLRIRLDGKNGASSGFTANIGAISLWRTA